MEKFSQTDMILCKKKKKKKVTLHRLFLLNYDYDVKFNFMNLIPARHVE